MLLRNKRVGTSFIRDHSLKPERSLVPRNCSLPPNMKTFTKWVVLGSTASLLSIHPVHALDAVQGGTPPVPLPLFPADNWWNLDVTSWPVDSGSAGYIAFINNGGTRHLHPDFGGNAATQQDLYGCYGFPFVVVRNVVSSDLQSVQFQYSDESDGVNHTSNTSFPFYPIPSAAMTQPYWIEGGDPGNVDLRSSQDRHLLIVDADRNQLYELYNVFYNATQGSWLAGSGAFFDMNTNNRRPEGWTSADAAGLAVLPGLVRYDEVYDPSVTDIRHALRFTVRATSGHVYPASHTAGSTVGAPPLGARLRLRSSIDVTLRTSDPSLQKLFRAFQRYGLVLADNGSDMYISGTYDPRWNNDVLNPAFSALTASDFEVLQLGYNPSSGPVSLSSVSINPSAVTGGQTSTGTVFLTAAAPSGGVTIALADNQGSVTIPSSINIAAGLASAAFSVSTTPVALTENATVTATLNNVSKSTTLTVRPPAVAAISLAPSSVTGGTSSTGTVSLTGAAPSGGTVVQLTSSKISAATVPANLTVPAGTSSKTFIVATTAVKANTSAIISATAGGATKSATLTIQKARH